MWEIAEPLRKAMDDHQEFKEEFERFFIGKQIRFVNRVQASNLLRVVLTRGPNGALAWYRAVRGVRRTRIRIVGEVQGLLVQTPHRFSNGVTLMSASDLPDSPNSRMLKDQKFFGLPKDFTAAVTFELDDVEYEDGGGEKGSAKFQEIAETLRQTVDACVLAGSVAPTVSTLWEEFADPQFHPAEFGRMWTGSQHEGRLPTLPQEVPLEMTGWVERYLALPQPVAEACRIPIQRLNLAHRRLTPGDKAIDGSICLEALLSGEARGELAHRIAVRTALLLEQSLERRLATAKLVKKFYDLRSRSVHGSASKHENANRQIANRQIAEDGLALCVKALRAIITSREVPQPEHWELSGGPHWNRFIPPATPCQTQEHNAG